MQILILFALLLTPFFIIRFGELTHLFKKKIWLVCERVEAFTHDFTHFIGIYAQINPHLRAREEGFEA